MLRNLKSARFMKGLTQEDIGVLSSTNRTYYNDIENGNRNISLKKAIQIGKVLGYEIDPEGLFFDDEKEEN